MLFTDLLNVTLIWNKLEITRLIRLCSFFHLYITDNINRIQVNTSWRSNSWHVNRNLAEVYMLCQYKVQLLLALHALLIHLLADSKTRSKSNIQQTERASSSTVLSSSGVIGLPTNRISLQTRSYDDASEANLHHFRFKLWH